MEREKLFLLYGHHPNYYMVMGVTELAATIGITLERVNIWFQYMRDKYRKLRGTHHYTFFKNRNSRTRSCFS